MSEDAINKVEKRTDDAEKRIDSLEKKFAVATNTVIVLAAVLGVGSYVALPKIAKEAARSQMDPAALSEIQSERDQTKKYADEMAHMSANGTMTIDGQCFKPKTLYICDRSGEGSYFATWFNCFNSSYALKQKASVLAQCDAPEAH